MISAFFFLKFKTQLRRTRPDVVRQLDESLFRAIEQAGGKITGDRFVISAVFNDESIGFWLDMYILIESLKKNIEATPDFFGYALVISSGIPGSPDQLCRFLANHSGIFVDDRAAKNLIPYASFERPSDWLKGMKKRKYGSGSYYRIKELKTFKTMVKDDPDLQKEATKIFEKDEGKNVLVYGAGCSQARLSLRKFCAKINGEFPELTICFGSMGLGALIDVWSSSIRALSGGQPSIEEIDNLWELLFRERIRDEVSDYIDRSVRRFLHLVFEYYIAAAKKKKRTPILALVNLHLAGNRVMQLLQDALAEINPESKKFIILGTGDEEIGQEKLELWGNIFDRIKKIENKTDGKKEENTFYPKLSTELWEIVYAISLFGRYFSPELFQRLFEEADINPAMILRALSILQSAGLIDNPREPRPADRQFEEHAREVLRDKDDRVKALVRGRLLSWALRRNISPCFRLLTIIAGLDGAKQIDDLLLLKSFSADIMNETVSGIEAAMKSGQFDELVSAKASAIRHIFKTSKALHSCDEKEIEKVFAENRVDSASPDFDAFPILKTQILVNTSAYHLGRRDWKAASENAKEALLLAQSKNPYCLPYAYRIFSLVCLSKQQINEAIEYLGFALANAEKTGNYLELAVSGYYAAAVHFLHGDVYNSARHARKSVEQSLVSGCPDWADRSRFLEGRLEFELGHYKHALEIFEALRKEPFGNRSEEKDALLAAWIYRCKTYLQNYEMTKPSLTTPGPEWSGKGCHDAELFEIENAYLSGDYKRAHDLSSSITNPFSSENNFLYTEQADWRSGFAQCEHLYFTHGENQNRMTSLFHTLSLSRLSESGREQALQDIQKLLRDETLCEMDPWDAVYFFAKYSLLEQTNAGPVDLSTAVSMAFKRLQRRAGRIEDIETRRQYLNGAYWNHKLSLAAKEFKLI